MNIRTSIIVYLCILFIAPIFGQEQPLRGVSFFSPRSQSAHSSRDIVGWHPHLYRYDINDTYAVFEIIPAYNHSVRKNRIAQALFNTDQLIISGSLIPNRGDQDILADYFGLSPTFQSRVILNPRIQNILCTINGYVGLDNLVSGLYARFTLPFGWTKWGLNLEEINISGNNTPFPALYMASSALDTPVNSFKEAIRGNVTFGDVQQGLSFGKISCSRTKKGVSDMRLVVGWNPVLTPYGHAGFNGQLIIPTGSRPNSEFLFEPVLGNGKHWEFGAGFSGHIVVWEQDADQQVAFHAQLDITHLCSARQRRSFDLRIPGQPECSRFNNQRFGSRYILIKEFDANQNYTGNLTPLINKTTLACKVRVDIQLDCSIMFGYTYRGFVWDIGYNGWIRSKEKIKISGIFPEKKFALKGIQNVRTNANTFSDITQSTATLMGNNLADQALVADTNSPIFITAQDLNDRSAGSPLLITHKLFTHIGHSWLERKNARTTPFIGIGGEIEFEGINTRATAQEHNNTLSQWGFWLQAGLAF